MQINRIPERQYRRRNTGGQAMTRKLTIEIRTGRQGNLPFTAAMGEVARQLEKGFLQGTESVGGTPYIFDVVEVPERLTQPDRALLLSRG